MPCHCSTRYLCRRRPALDQRPSAARSTSIRLGVAKGERSIPRPNALSRKPGWEPLFEESGRPSIDKTEIQAAAPQQPQIALDRAEFGVELHPHRRHLMASDASVPDLAMLIGSRGLIGREPIDVFSLDVAG